MPTNGKTKAKPKKLRSSSGKVVKNISDKENARIHRERTTGKGPKRSVREGHTSSGRKTGRSQYVTKARKLKTKIKSTGVKKAKPKASVLKRRRMKKK